jgi:protein-histidine pros-kinase
MADMHSPRSYAQTIAAYAATQIFEVLCHNRPDYVYREATQNPTNPRDRAAGFEVDVSQHFRSDPNVQEIVNDRHGELGCSLYLAKPIRIEDGQCLECRIR